MAKKRKLEDTIDGMKSKDYKERFKAEYEQLSIRIDKLSKAICDRYAGKSKHKLAYPLTMLNRQLDAMIQYQTALEERAFVEGIDLK